jgi:hypothetical protein
MNRQQRRAVMKSAPTTPSRPLSPRVKRHCLSISPAEPVFLQFTSINPNYVKHNCHLNVAHLVRERGGRLVTGWMIWEGPFIDAEFHSVWQDEEGRLIDVTPRADGEKTILFLPDPARRLDPGTTHELVWNWSNRTDRLSRPFGWRGIERYQGYNDTWVLSYAAKLGMGLTNHEVIAAVLAAHHPANAPE